MLCGNKIDLPRQVSTSEAKILADKEKMLFFETSAKNATGVSNMMYTCISKLPYFDQFQVDKEKLIQDLANNNNKNTEGDGIFDIDVDKNNNYVDGPENSSNIILNKKNIDEEIKNCGCWKIYVFNNIINF